MPIAHKLFNFGLPFDERVRNGLLAFSLALSNPRFCTWLQNIESRYPRTKSLNFFALTPINDRNLVPSALPCEISAA